MKPKEKAEELVNRFAKLPEEGSLMWYLSFEIAKKCALIAVDEILNGYEFDSLDIENKRIMDNINYWDKVKQEINNL